MKKLSNIDYTNPLLVEIPDMEFDFEHNSTNWPIIERWMLYNLPIYNMAHNNSRRHEFIESGFGELEKLQWACYLFAKQNQELIADSVKYESAKPLRVELTTTSFLALSKWQRLKLFARLIFR